MQGKTIVGLLRGDTSTKWFHDWVYPYAELRFIRGRLNFGPGPAPFSSIIAIWRGKQPKPTPRFVGLSIAGGDTKPTAPNMKDATYYEMDTGLLYGWDGRTWVVLPMQFEVSILTLDKEATV